MAQRILGLDIGTTTVRAVVITSTYRHWSIAAAASQRVAPDGEGAPPLRARQIAAIRTLLTEAPLSFEVAFMAFPGVSATHTLTLPFTDQRKIEQTIGFEVEGQIPFDLTEVAWDWQPLRARESGTELLVAVVKKEELAGLLTDLAPIGVDPHAIIPPAPAYTALFTSGALFGTEPTWPGDGVEGLLDLDADRASLCVVGEGGCEVARTFQVTSSTIDHVVREVRATLRAWRARSKPKAARLRRLLLAGEAPQHPDLAEALANEVDGAIEPLAFASSTGELSPEEAPAFALALALALRGHHSSHAQRLNLRRGELAFRGDAQDLHHKLARLGAWAIFLLILALISSGVKVFALARQEKLLDTALCDATQKLTGKCYDSDEQAVAALRGKGTAAAAVPKMSALDVFSELAVRTPSDTASKFDRIEITKEKLHLQGVTDTAENIDRIISSLRGARCFDNAHSGGARKRSSDGKFEFTIDADLSCDPTEKPVKRN